MAGSSSSLLFVAALLVVLSVCTVSAQDLGMAPSPSPDAGAGYSVGASIAVICSSLALSILGLLKN